MGILSKIFLHGLLLVTLVCVGLGGHPRQIVHGPHQPTSIRSAQESDFECLLLDRRAQRFDCSHADDLPPSLLGILPSVNEFAPVASWLVPEPCPVARGIVSRLVVVEARARAPPQRTLSVAV